MSEYAYSLATRLETANVLAYLHHEGNDRGNDDATGRARDHDLELLVFAKEDDCILIDPDYEHNRVCHIRHARFR